MNSFISRGISGLKSSFLVWFPLIIILLIRSKLTLDPVLLPRFILLSGFLLGISIFILLRKIVLRDQVFYKKNNIFFKAFIIYVIVSVFSFLISSNVSDAIFEFQKILLTGIVIFLICLYYDNYLELINYLVMTTVVLSLIIGFIGIYELIKTLNEVGLSHENMYHIKSTFAHKNIFSEILFLCLAFNLHAVLQQKSIWKYLGGFAAFLCLFFITILMSRAIWIALAGSLFSTLIIFFVFKSIHKNQVKKENKKGLLFLVILFLLTISLAVFIYTRQDGFSTFQKQTVKIVNFNYGSTKDRIQLWKKSVEIVKDNPFYGTGLASWKIEILKHGNRNLRSEDQITFYQRPHNDYIWVLAEQGILGLLLYLSLFAVILWQVFSILKKEKSDSEYLFFLLMFFSIIGYMIFSLFSFPKERIEHGIILSFIFSTVILKYNVISESKNPIVKVKTRQIIVIIIIIMLLSNLYVGIQRFNSENHTRKAFAHRNKSNWTGMIHEIDQAQSFFYKMDPFSTPIAWYKGMAWFNLNKIDEALISFHMSYLINPYHIHVLNNLGTCYELKNQHVIALDYFNKALEISPKFKNALFNKCAVEYNLNKKDKAYATLRQIDTSNTSNKYYKFLNVLLNPIIERSIDKIENEQLKHVLISIAKSDKWMFEIHKKSILNNQNFESQLIDDGIYTLLNINKSITEKEAEELRNKYNQNI